MKAKGILFDARVIRPGMTGIGNYARSLLRALPTDSVRIGILLPEGSPYIHDFPGCTIHLTRVNLTDHPRTELYEQFVIPHFCRRHGYGTFVSFEGRVPLWGRDLQACAFIYDLAYLNVAGTHGLKYSLLLRLSQWIARVRGATIITISNTIRDQIAASLRFERERIHVVYPSDSELGQVTPERVSGVRFPYILATSMTNPRKNLGNLLKGFALVRTRHPNLQLVITGSTTWIDQVLEGKSHEAIVNAGFATEGQLRTLYENAAVYIYPSFDEGFGIPLLDARFARCPVACSDIPVFREVLHDDAAYFDPTNPESLAAAVERAMGSADEHRDTNATQTLRERFSWRQSAQSLLQALGLRANT
jgi:glycosyltransferase involved in cell wall biosynthesis